jgi:hypothetical protein
VILETPALSLTLTGSSSNPGLVPNTNITVHGSGSSRTVRLVPLANASGTATITLTVSDGVATASDSFVLMVAAVNDPPTPFILESTTNFASVTGWRILTNPPANLMGTNRTVTLPSANESDFYRLRRQD